MPKEIGVDSKQAVGRAWNMVELSTSGPGLIYYVRTD